MRFTEKVGQLQSTLPTLVVGHQVLSASQWDFPSSTCFDNGDFLILFVASPLQGPPSCLTEAAPAPYQIVEVNLRLHNVNVVLAAVAWFKDWVFYEFVYIFGMNTLSTVAGYGRLGAHLAIVHRLWRRICFYKPRRKTIVV